MSSRAPDTTWLLALLAASLLLLGVAAVFLLQRRAAAEQELAMVRATEAALAQAELQMRRAEEAPALEGPAQTPSSRAAEWLEREEPWKARLEGLDREGVLELGVEVLGWDREEYDLEGTSVEKLRGWFLQDYRWRDAGHTGYSAV